MQFRPEFSVSVPENWHVKASITLTSPDNDANIITSSESLEQNLTTEDYAKLQGDMLRREFPGFSESIFEPTTVAGRSAFLRRFQWRPPDGDPVTQLQIYFVANGRGFATTATTVSASFSRLEGQLVRILQGIQLTPDTLV